MATIGKLRISIILGLAALLVGGACLITASSPARAQAEGAKPAERPPLAPVAVDTTYTFIDYDTNHLYIGPDSTLMNKFFEKWLQVTSTGRGNINIVHIGGSHVQGGTLPHRIRCNILRYYPDLVASRGMIFPYSAARKCNNPFDYKVDRSHALALTRNVYKEPEHPMGLCGIAVTAFDSTATVGIRLNEPAFDFATMQVVLLGESPEGVVPSLICRDRELVPSDIDTVRHRYLFNLPGVADSFRVVMPCDSGQSFSLRGIYLRNRRPGITYHSIGVNGAAVPDYLKCQYFTDDLRMVKPDLVVFGIGINDASGPNFDTVVFKNDYLRLIDSIRSVNPDCAFIFITNNDSFKKVKRRTYSVNTNGPKARDVFYRLADETKGAVWDQFLVMGGLKSMDQWRLAGMAQYDRVHFTRSGYEMVADLFTNAFVEALLHHTQQSGSLSKPVQTIKPTPRPHVKPSINDERYHYISY